MYNNQEQDIDAILMAPKMPKAVTPVSAADFENFRRYEILSFLGPIINPAPSAPPGLTRLTIYLAAAQGQVVGGGLAGALIASGPVLIMFASFTNATFDHLPLDDDEVEAAMWNQYCQDGWHHHLEISDSYGIINGTPPPEVYSWAAGQNMSKT